MRNWLLLLMFIVLPWIGYNDPAWAAARQKAVAGLVQEAIK